MAAGQDFRIRFDHVAIAVSDIDRARAFFARYFPIQDRNPKTLSEQVSGALYWQDFFLGGFRVELIHDPPGQEGFVSEFVRKRGGGLHHISFELDNFAPTVDKLKADGVRIVDEQEFDDGNATVFISPRAAFGTLIQLWRIADYDAHRAAPVDDGLRASVTPRSRSRISTRGSNSSGATFRLGRSVRSNSAAPPATSSLRKSKSLAATWS